MGIGDAALGVRPCWGADAVGVGEGALEVGDVGVVAGAAAEVDSPDVRGAFMSLWI